LIGFFSRDVSVNSSLKLCTRNPISDLPLSRRVATSSVSSNSSKP
jgi:hypothetical protein